MMKRILVAVVLAAVAVLPAILAGCEKDEIRTERRVKIENQVVDQHTVVD